MWSLHRFSLFSRLLAAFVLVVTIAFAVEAWLVIRVGEVALDSVVLEDLSGRANDRLQAVSQFLEDRSRELRSWSGLSIMDDVLLQDRVLAIENFLLERRRTHAAMYAALTVLDRSEMVIASTDLTRLGTTLNVAALAPHLESGDVTRWSDLPADPATTQPVVRVVQPIVSGLRMEPIGWLLADVRWDAVERIVREREFASEGGRLDRFYLLVDATGRVIAGDRSGARPSGQPLIGSDYLVVTHRARRGTIAPLRGHAVVGAWSKSTAYAVDRIFVKLVIASTLLGVLLSAGVSFALARYITRRLRRLIEGTRKVAGGDLAYRVEEDPADEFGELARAFNVMGGELAATRDGLESALARWKALVTHAPDVILTVDREGTILFVNRVVAGLNVDQVIGSSVDQYTPPEQAPKLHAAIERVFRTGDPESIELEGSGPEGTSSWYSSRIGPVLREGTIVAVTIIASDITERKRLEKEVLEIAEDERARIGRDLHDGLGQSLTGVALLSTGLEKQLTATAPTQASQARQIGLLIDETIGLTRTLAKELFPSALEHEGLRGALRELIVGVERGHGVRCRMMVADAAVPADRRQATHVFRIVQEAVSNALRHGQARHIAIVLARHENGRILAIRNDGRGLPDMTTLKEGMGLRSMRYRASVLGGALEISGDRGGGAVVICRFP